MLPVKQIPTGLRDLYAPVQPGVQQSDAGVAYQEFLPAAALQPVIYCYWQLYTTQKLAAPFHYRVVADGCIDIFFSLEAPQESFVMGFCKKYTSFPLPETFYYVGVRFLPTMFPQVFNLDAALLSNRDAPLHTVLPETAGFISDHFRPGQTAAEACRLLDEHLLACISGVSFDNDTRLYGALGRILENAGRIGVEKDLDTGISPRQLRRLFQYYIGTTPKNFAQVVRFQYLLREQGLQGKKLFFDAGYYDQAHFIREFKNFYGITPGQVAG